MVIFKRPGSSKELVIALQYDEGIELLIYCMGIMMLCSSMLLMTKKLRILHEKLPIIVGLFFAGQHFGKPAIAREINIYFAHAVPGYLDAFVAESFCLAFSAAGATIHAN
jgi:hypothetical protein